MKRRCSDIVYYTLTHQLRTDHHGTLEIGCNVAATYFIESGNTYINEYTNPGEETQVLFPSLLCNELPSLGKETYRG